MRPGGKIVGWDADHVTRFWTCALLVFGRGIVCVECDCLRYSMSEGSILIWRLCVIIGVAVEPSQFAEYICVGSSTTQHILQEPKTFNNLTVFKHLIIGLLTIVRVAGWWYSRGNVKVYDTQRILSLCILSQKPTQRRKANQTNYFGPCSDSCECDTVTSVTQTIPSSLDGRISSSLEFLPSPMGYVAVVVVLYVWYVNGPFPCVWTSMSNLPLASVCGLDWWWDWLCCERDIDRSLYRLPRE